MSNGMLEEVKKEKANLLPTPTVGEMVLWFDRNLYDRSENALPLGLQDTAKPAIVLGIEGPGKLSVKVLTRGDDKHRAGCCHITHPCHERRYGAETVNAGSWAYRDESKIPEEAYTLHKHQISKREAAIKAESAATLKRTAKA